MRNITYIFLALFVCLFSKAQPTTDLSAEAAKAYGDGDFVKSVNLYQKEIQERGADSKIYYNLGNAYTKLENYGSAVLSYRKALKLQPSNRDASHNLAYVEQIVGLENEESVQDKNLDPTPASISFFSHVRSFFEYPGSDCWAWIAGSLFLIFCVALAAYLFLENPRRKKLAFFTAIPAIFLSLAALGLSFSSKASVLKVTECVLINPQAVLREIPDAQGKEVGVPLAGGTTFQILESQNSGKENAWIKVWLNDDFTGWIPKSEVELVEV